MKQTFYYICRGKFVYTTVIMFLKVKKFPWLYLVIYNHCPVSVYSTAWRALTCMVVLYKDGFNDLNLFKVVRYRLSSSEGTETECEVVTDSFLISMKKY